MKFLLAALFILTSVSAFAQRDIDGSVVLRDGRTILRINVGDDRDDRDSLIRIRRLEQAVRDLQDQVYQLQTAPRRESYVVCSGEFFVAGTMSARGNTETEARANLSSACQSKGVHSMHCRTSRNENNVRCETSN